MEIPLFVTSAHGDEVQCFDRSSGNLQWKQTLPAAAVSAHLWRRQSAMEIDLHAHDQAELVVASDSTALAAAASLGTVHVHKHDKGLYARLHPPMRVPAHVAKSIMEVTGAGQSKSVGPGISKTRTNSKWWNAIRCCCTRAWRCRCGMTWNDKHHWAQASKQAREKGPSGETLPCSTLASHGRQSSG